MKRNLISNTNNRGVTLMELTLVISIIVLLSSIVTVGVSYYRNWTTGAQAGEDLKAVYQAQKLYLADNPTELPRNLTWDLIKPYYPGVAPAAAPTITGSDDKPYDINFDKMPPTSAYGDKTGPGDSIWDTGN